MPLSVLIFCAILFLLVCCLRAARIGALVAFLMAGILSGPYLLNLFELNHTWEFLGELGILFLWFSIGLEINMRRLWDMRQTIFGFGLSQVMIAAFMMFPILFVSTPWSVLGCIMIALILAMSSTSEDLQLLTDRNQLNTNAGRNTFSILLFQDLLSIPLLAMLPVFAGRSFNLGATVIDIFVFSLLLILGVVVVGRLILNPIMRRVANLRCKEAMLLVVLVNIAIWATLLELLGLPAGLGAFLAGMLISETIFRHEVTAEINPYATLFLAFFFISLGMGLNVPLLLDKWYAVVLGLVGLVVIKFCAMFIAARVRRASTPDATFTALVLAQGGEFGLLMLRMMKDGGINAIPETSSEILTAIIILSIMTTPLLLWVYDRLRRSGRLFATYKEKTLGTPAPEVFICGFGRVGQIVARMLDANGVSYIALDVDVNTVVAGQDKGFNVVYGNSANADVLRELGMAPRKTRAVVVALDNAEAAKDVLLTVKSIAPRTRVFVRARNLAETRKLKKYGAAAAFPETIESSFFLGRNVLGALGVSEHRIDDVMGAMRANNYSALNIDINGEE